MNGTEFGLCVTAILCSSASQLVMKTAASLTGMCRLLVLAVGASLQLGAALLAMFALKTLQLSQLIPFAAAAYVLVPLGGQFFFRERLQPAFWAGALLIITGIAIIHI